MLPESSQSRGHDSHSIYSKLVLTGLMVERMIFFLFSVFSNCFQRLEWIKKYVGACSLCLLLGLAWLGLVSLGLAWLGLNHFFHLLQTQVKTLQLFFCFSSAAAKLSLNAQWRTRNQKGLKGEFL